MRLVQLYENGPTIPGVTWDAAETGVLQSLFRVLFRLGVVARRTTEWTDEANPVESFRRTGDDAVVLSVRRRPSGDGSVYTVHDFRGDLVAWTRDLERVSQGMLLDLLAVAPSGAAGR